MALVTLESAKMYLRVDSSDEDDTIETLLVTAGRLCADVARLTEEQWESICADSADVSLTPAREILRTAILYTIGYLYEHREEANHHDLMLTLRAILFSLREGVV